MKSEETVESTVAASVWDALSEPRQKYCKYFEHLTASMKSRRNECMYFEATAAIAHAIGDELTELLAIIGFNDDYSTTAYGNALETIIDSVNNAMILQPKVSRASDI